MTYFRTMVKEIIFLVLTIFGCGTVTLDPCDSYSLLPRAEYRGGLCDYVYDKGVCDRFIPSNTWYRAVALTRDLTIQTTTAHFQTCGTKFPFWMNGTHPTVGDGVVERTVCQTDLFSTCSVSKMIKVKHCGNFFVYNLPAVDACSSAYCFGENESCPPFDPCDIYGNMVISYNSYRAINYVGDSRTLCDRFDTSVWYKFEGQMGYLDIATKCPVSTMCGTERPIWIAGTVIENANGTRIGMVCVKDGDNCCGSSAVIEYKPCSVGFTVYRFRDTYAGQCHTYCTDDVHVTTSVITTRHDGGNGRGTPTVTPEPADKHRENDSSKEDKGRNDNWIGAGFVGLAIGALVSGLAVYLAMQYRIRKVSVSTIIGINNAASEKYVHANTVDGEDSKTHNWP